MNIQTALLPHKHVRFCDSIIALAGLARKMLQEPRTIDELWALIDRENKNWPTKPNFTHLVFAVDILFAIHEVNCSLDGRVQLVASQ